jgi:hypothetical protein
MSDSPRSRAQLEGPGQDHTRQGRRSSLSFSCRHLNRPSHLSRLSRRWILPVRGIPRFHLPTGCPSSVRNALPQKIPNFETGR